MKHVLIIINITCFLCFDNTIKHADGMNFLFLHDDLVDIVFDMRRFQYLESCSVHVLGTFSSGSPAVSSISRISPSSNCSSLSFVFTKVIGQLSLVMSSVVVLIVVPQSCVIFLTASASRSISSKVL